MGPWGIVLITDWYRKDEATVDSIIPQPLFLGCVKKKKAMSEQVREPSSDWSSFMVGGSVTWDKPCPSWGCLCSEEFIPAIGMYYIVYVTDRRHFNFFLFIPLSLVAP